MSNTHPEEAHHVKKGHHIMLKGHPCRIAEVKTSKTGKHGHAKCNITGIDVFDQRKYNEVHPGHIVLAAFNPIKVEYDVTDIANGHVDCLNEDGGQDNFPLPEGELADQITEAFERGAYTKVTVLSAPVGENEPPLISKIVEFKEEKEE